MAKQEKKRAPWGKGKQPERVTAQDRRAALRKLQEEVLPVLGAGKMEATELQAWEAALQEMASKFPFNINKTTRENLQEAAKSGYIGVLSAGQPPGAAAGFPAGVSGTQGAQRRRPGDRRLPPAPIGTPKTVEPAVIVARPPLSVRDPRAPGPPAAATPLPTRPGLGSGYDPARGPTLPATEPAPVNILGQRAPVGTVKKPEIKGTPYGSQNLIDVRGPQAPGLPAAATLRPTSPTLAPGYDPTKGVTKPPAGQPPGATAGFPVGVSGTRIRPGPAIDIVPSGLRPGEEMPLGAVPPAGQPPAATTPTGAFAQRLERLRQTTQNAGLEVPPPRRLSPRSRFTMTPRLVNPPLSTSTGSPLPFMATTPLPAATATPQAAASVRARANQLSQRLTTPSPALPFLPPAPQPTGPLPAFQEAAPTAGSLQETIRRVRLGGQ